MWQILSERRDLIEHRLGVFLLVMFPQRLPVVPDHRIVAERARKTLVDVRQKMQVSNVSLVEHERAERTTEVHASARAAVVLRLFRAALQVALHLLATVRKGHLLFNDNSGHIFCQNANNSHSQTLQFSQLSRCRCTC